MNDIRLVRGGRFLPYGYNVPTALEECYTWQTALQWLADNVKDIKEIVDNIDPGGEIDLSDIYRRLDEIDVEVASLGVQVENIPVYNMDATPTEDSENVVSSNGIFEQFSAVDTSITTLQNTIADLSDALDELSESTTEDIEDITEMLTTVTNNVTNLTNNVTTLTSDVTNFQSALTALTGRVGSLETTVSQHTQDISDIGDDITAINQALAGKQNTLTFDTTPTQESTNPVTSGGVYDAIQDVVESIPEGVVLDDSVTEHSVNGVKSSGIYQYGEGIRSEIPDITNLATKAEVTAVEQEIPDITGLATKAELQTGLSGKQNTLSFDSTPTENSQNPVTSGGVHNAIGAVEQMIPDISGLATKTELQTGLSSKQNTLSFDSTPILGSGNPVTSGGVYDAISEVEGHIPDTSDLVTENELEIGLSGKQNTLTFDSTPTQNSQNPVTSNGIYDAIDVVAQDVSDIEDNIQTLATKTELETGLAGKQNTLTFDNSPTPNSNNPVKSGGIYNSLGPQVVFRGMHDQPTNLFVTNSIGDINSSTASEGDVPSAKLVNTYVNQMINDINIPDVSGLATKSELSTGLSGKQDTLTFDNSPTANSNNPVKSGGIYDSINAVQQSIPDVSTFATKSELQTGLSGKQNTLTFDTTPISGSNNPVTSDGVYDAIPDITGLATKSELTAVEQEIPDVTGLATKTELQTGLSGKQNTLTFDTQPTQNSQNPVTSGGVYSAIPDISNLATKSELTAVEQEIPDVTGLATKTELQTGLSGKQNTLTFDTQPTQNSQNPVTSGGVYSAIPDVSNLASKSELQTGLSGKQNTLTFDTQPTQNSQNPVTSGGIYQYGEGIRSQIPSVSGFATTTQLNNGLATKQDTLTFDTTPTENSQNPVTSGGIYNALQNVQPSAGKSINHVIETYYVGSTGSYGEPKIRLKLFGNDDTYLVNTASINPDFFPGKKLLFKMYGELVLDITNPKVGGTPATGHIKLKIKLNTRSCGIVTNNNIDYFTKQYVEPGFRVCSGEILENTLVRTDSVTVTSLGDVSCDFDYLFNEGTSYVGSTSPLQVNQSGSISINVVQSDGYTTHLDLIKDTSSVTVVSDNIVCEEITS